MKKTVGNTFPHAERVESGHENFFAGILKIVGTRCPDERAGQAMRCYVRDYLCTCDLKQFRKQPGEPYSRFYLGRDGATGWEALMMCWEKGSATTIHGHPCFAAYNFASGRFRIELFDLDDAKGLQPTGVEEVVAGDGFFAIGRPGAFDNHIHRITCLSDVGHSLHVYCGDARKGVVFAGVD